MLADTDITETRQGRILARLAAMSLELAEDLQARALAAETTEEAVQLTAAFHQAARSARQSLALELRMAHQHDRAFRDRERHDREFRAERDRLSREAVIRRRTELRSRMRHAIWEDFKDDTGAYNELSLDLEDLLEDESKLSTFLEETLPDQLERLRAKWGLGREAPELEPYADDDDPDDEDEAADAAADTPPPSAPPPRLNGQSPQPHAADSS